MNNQFGLFIGDEWHSKKDLIDDFRLKKHDLDEINILLAYYSYMNYTGEAFVLFEKNGKLYEVNGSHCSCYGLEGQWEPEEVCLQALIQRPKQSYYKKQLDELLKYIDLTDIESTLIMLRLIQE